MNRLLAIDTATDALSIALQLEGEVRAIHRVMPRQHQQQLFALLDELFHGVSVRELSLDGILFGRGPGSFTGLRIAASAAQGLAFSLGLPVAGVSSLETQVRTLLRTQAVATPCLVLSTIDARIGQLYSAVYRVDGDRVELLGSAGVCKPEELDVSHALARYPELPLIGIGSGLALLDVPPAGCTPWETCHAELLPEARDMFAAAPEAFAQGAVDDPSKALPDYVQKRIGWKTLAEQGRSA